MNARRLLTAVLVLAACAGSASAQAAGGAAQPTVSIQMGADFGYNLGTQNVGTAFDMSLMLALSDNLQAAVTFLNGDATNFQSYRMLELYYSFIPRLGVMVSVGSQITPAAVPVAGLGLYSTILSRNVQGSLQTGLRLLVGYLMPVGTSVSTGTFRLGVVAWVGM